MAGRNAIWGPCVLIACLALPPTGHAREPLVLEDRAAARAVLDLSRGWRFRFGPQDSAATVASLDDSGWQTVDLPHTWNRVGTYGTTPAADLDVRRGEGWYRLNIDMAPQPKGRRQFLQFDGVANVASVWVNGTLAAVHKGAFSAFRADITGLLRPGSNLIAVRADNSAPARGSATADVLPLGGDYVMHGGIYRGVSLITTGDVQIDLLDHGSPGVYLKAARIGTDSADIEVRTALRNFGRSRRLAVATTILDADGRVVARDSAPATIDRGQTISVARTLAVASPRLWQGRADPYLYRVVVELRDGARIVDRTEQPLGIRSFRFDAAQGFLLNGKPMRLHGVSRHQDRQGKGWAISPQDEREDMRIIAEMGANTVRQAHYQQSQEWTSLADRYGMMVWAELPYTHEASLTHEEPTAALRENAAEQLRELIRQNYNHPSIVLWGIGNEIDIGAAIEAMSHGGKGHPPKTLDLLRELHALSGQEDPTRATAYADCCFGTSLALPGAERLIGVTDVQAYNRYFGWYYGKSGDLGPALDRLHAELPGTALALSEYGAGAALSQHSDDPAGGPVNPNGRPHPEEYQAWFHEKSWPQIRDRPFVSASWIWAMFDFATGDRAEGDALSINDKGLVAYDHKTRKDAFYYYKAQWSAEPVLHLTGRRYIDRAYAMTDVKAYSNAADATLSVNGTVIGTVPCADRICLWRGVRLTPGTNQLTAMATNGGTALTDTITWNAPDPADGLRLMAGTLTGATLADRRRFGSDTFFAGGDAGRVIPFRPGRPSPPKIVEGTSTPELYASYREGTFRYDLPVPNGEWNLTLHMFEPDAAQVATRTFDVTVNGRSLLNRFSPGAAAGGTMKAVVRRFPVEVTDGRLAIDFGPAGGKALVAAIEVSR